MIKSVEKLVESLIKTKNTIATMESCTGGGMANEITNIPGASEIFKFGATTYSNEFKIKMGVSADVIEKYSVYSAETAKEMCFNIAKFTNADYGVGITGKLKRFDPCNSRGENDVVFVCIYDSKNNEYYPSSIKVSHEKREDNKKEVIDSIAKSILKLLKESER